MLAWLPHIMLAWEMSMCLDRLYLRRRLHNAYSLLGLRHLEYR